jgi:hypothetical protein
MTEPLELLRRARHVVVQDFPDRGVPDALLAAGATVTIYGGPDPADVSTQDLDDGVVVLRQRGERPESADLLYVYRPFAEIDGILTEAERLGVAAIWRQPEPGGPDADAAAWRERVGGAGFAYVEGPITDVAEEIATSR